MSATTPHSSPAGAPSSQRPTPDQPHREGGPTDGPELAPPISEEIAGGRFDAAREMLKRIGPYAGYGAFFVFVFLLFLYWSFPWDRVRDSIIADFEKSQQQAAPGGGGPRQSLGIGKLEPSWFTGVVLKDVTLTTTPADLTKPSSVLRADEIRVRVSLGSIFSNPKDISFSAKALGGTLEGSVTHKPTAVKDVKPDPKNPLATLDRTLKLEIADVALADLAPLKDAIGAPVAGTLKGSIDLTLDQARADRANGTITLDLEGFCLPGDKTPRACGTGDPEKDGKVHFKVPALTAVFGSDDFPLPPIRLGNVPVQVIVKNGIARIEKMEAKGGDVDFAVDGQVTLREQPTDSDLNLGLRFKFNESYRRKAEGLIMALESEPKLRAGRRPDGFYALRLIGLLSNPQVMAAGSGGAPSGFGGMQTVGPLR